MQILTPPNPLTSFHLTDDSPLTLADLPLIREQGLTRWAMAQTGLLWQDERLEWDRLPNQLRSTILTDALEALALSVRYAVPIRYLGRVILFALLPAWILSRARRSVPA